MQPNQPLVPQIEGTSIFIKVCKKVPHLTLQKANEILEKISNREQTHKKPIRAYKCPRCGLFHLTSMTRKQYKNQFKKRFKTNKKMENTTNQPTVLVSEDNSMNIKNKETCKTCKHFGAQGRFGLVKHEGESRFCSAYLFSDEDNENFVSMPDFVVTFGNMNGAKGCLRVNENFGCVNHNPNFDDL
ncbi:hypothetical protein FHS57_005113 [Runella defluvii]|uniref:Uncharacterized protein n=1 Tax=Runella defluvii TaxID=370973 RepID=A0A7W5ZT60_9BACT|nr:hypothetical protein [Runella defluvii]MBB3841092.1 hypothetical protein [Runella defluvii]